MTNFLMITELQYLQSHKGLDSKPNELGYVNLSNPTVSKYPISIAEEVRDPRNYSSGRVEISSAFH